MSKLCIKSTDHNQLGKISTEPHTIVKQNCFPDGNVLFLSMFSQSRTECIMQNGAVRKFYHQLFQKDLCFLSEEYLDLHLLQNDAERLAEYLSCVFDSSRNNQDLIQLLRQLFKSVNSTLKQSPSEIKLSQANPF